MQRVAERYVALTQSKNAGLRYGYAIENNESPKQQQPSKINSGSY